MNQNGLAKIQRHHLKYRQKMLFSSRFLNRSFRRKHINLNYDKRCFQRLRFRSQELNINTHRMN